MVNISRAQREFKIPVVLLAFAITLTGIITDEKTKENQDMILRVQREKLS